MIKMLKNMLKEQKGLTLIELLAVIVILGIIAAIAIPSIGKVIEKSKDKAVVAEAIQIIEGARLANVEGVGTVSADKATITWNNAALTKYVSKVKDTEYTVTYTVASNTYTITGHNAAKVITTTLTDETVKTAVVTEEKLAETANKND